jgi:four helix bundle protein
MREKERSTFGDAKEESGEAFDFENLRVYRHALDFIDRVYEITGRFPAEERYGLTDQFRRAATSIALNIAEGSGGSKAEFRQFLRVSRRSVRESVAVTEISGRRSYISSDERRELRLMCVDLSRMLTGLIRALSPNAQRQTTNDNEESHVPR